MLAMNKSGQQLIRYIEVEESSLNQHEHYQPITGSFAFIECQNKFLVGYNKWRQQWEFPAGKVEANESFKACAIRELFEETNQHVQDLTYKGLVEIYDTMHQQTRYRTIYYGKLDQLTSFINNDEMDQIKLWDLVEPIGDVDAVDLKMLELAVLNQRGGQCHE